MIAAHHLVFGRKYGETFLMPFYNNAGSYIAISTRTSDLIIDWGDGTTSNYITKKLFDYSTASIVNDNDADSSAYKTYSTPFTGDVKIISPSSNDVYSLRLMRTTYNLKYTKYNILDFKSFISQFKNLYSLWISSNSNGVTTEVAKIKGDLSQIPNSLERFRIDRIDNYENASTDMYMNVSNFSNQSNLKYFEKINVGYSFNVYGDLSKLPIPLQFFKLAGNKANTFTYTSGKVWASSFDTLDLGNASLSTTDTDNLLIDMANSITTAIGGKVIRLANSIRTSASDTAVAYLQSLGFTITVLGKAAPANSKILDLPLQNSFTDTTGFNTMIAGGTSNLPTFTLDGSEYYADFNGSQSIKTNGSLIINNDKVSISFWMKTSQNNSYSAYITELSTSTDSNNSFFILNEPSLLNCRNKNQGYNGKYISKNTSIFRHYVMIFNRSETATNEVKIYVDGVLQNATQYGAVDNSGSFGNYPLFLGQRGGTGTNGFIGQIKFFKMFNYPLSQTEITNLYNKTM